MRAAAVATAQAAAVDIASFELLVRMIQHVHHVVVRGSSVTALELHGLAGAWKSTYCHHAAARISADQIANEKIAAAELVEIFIDDEANKQIALCFLLLLRRQFGKCFAQDGVSGSIP